MHTMTFMLVCGSLVSSPEPSSQLFKVAEEYVNYSYFLYTRIDSHIILRFEFNHLFAFTVDGLIPCLLSSLLIDLVHRTFIEGYDITTYIGKILRSAPVVARHTAIIHIQRSSKTGNVKGLKYIWANPDMRPFGNVLPFQCPECFAFRPWSKKKQGLGNRINAYYFVCQGEWYDKKERKIVYCKHMMVFEPETPVNRVADSDWISMDWP
jgi:hypothetical protein